MAQLDRRKRPSECSKTPKSQTSPTFEQLLKVEETYWSPTKSPTLRISHDQEVCFSPSHNKKSVLSKVKERAMKLKHSLSGRKKYEHDPTNDDNSAPWGGVTLYADSNDEQDDDDPEYLGAPMYESEAAPEALKETARQHPRAVPVVCENHRAPIRMMQGAATENNTPVSQKLEPAYASMSDATHRIVSKLAGLAVATQEPQQQEAFHNQVTRKLGQIAVAPSSEGKKMSENAGNLNTQTWDRSVSVRQYFSHKIDPGEDERALSQAIADAISPGKETRDTSVVEKVKEVVASFFRQEENSNSMGMSESSPSADAASSKIPTSTEHNPITSTKAHSSKVHYPPMANSSTLIPFSSNAYEAYEEENHGRVLQTN